MRRVKDWARESVRMGDYYQRAWLTIAAIRTNGIFSAVDASAVPRVARLPYRDRQQQGHFYLQCLDATRVAKDFKTRVTDSEGLDRGWVYQEWVLSRRIVTSADGGAVLSLSEWRPLVCDRRLPAAGHPRRAG